MAAVPPSRDYKAMPTTGSDVLISHISQRNEA